MSVCIIVSGGGGHTHIPFFIVSSPAVAPSLKVNDFNARCSVEYLRDSLCTDIPKVSPTNEEAGDDFCLGNMGGILVFSIQKSAVAKFKRLCSQDPPFLEVPDIQPRWISRRGLKVFQVLEMWIGKGSFIKPLL